MNSQNHGANSGLPSFQTFLWGQNDTGQSQGNPNFYNGASQPSNVLDLSSVSKSEPVFSQCSVSQSGSPSHQSLYYKECLPSFANFMNYPQVKESTADCSNPTKEMNPYESSRHGRVDTPSTHASVNDNFYSHKLNEMSQMWNGTMKSGEGAASCAESYFPNRTTNHPLYSQYNPYNFMNFNHVNNMSLTSNNYSPHYHQQNSYQQYGMYTGVKAEEYHRKSMLHTQSLKDEDENDYEDLDSMILKRRKPSSTSKRAKKMRGGIEDCNYELCNMWDEVAIPVKNENFETERSHSSVGSDSESQQELVKSEPTASSCDSEKCYSNKLTCESKANLIRPVTIFNFIADDSVNGTCRQFLEAERRLCQHLKTISFGEPVSHIYNPLVYAFETHLKFLETFCTSDKTVLFLAMNPGPFGMSQNGVPFGEVSAVRDWIGIRGNVQKPAREHPKRCITGLDCHRSEVSGSRFWGFFKKVCGTPEVFFRHCFVHNLCPLAFMSPTGRNITPPELKADQRNALNQACDMALVETLNILQVKIIVCIGKFVESRVQAVLKNQGNNEIRVERITHPSPINPAANKGWDDMVYQQLKDIGIMSYFTRGE